MTFQKEADFEEALIKLLADKGWEKEVIRRPTEQDLIKNWAKILYDNNRGIDRLNNYPLTDGEMQQILEQITELRTPLKLNGFINGKRLVFIVDEAHRSTFGAMLSIIKATFPNAIFFGFTGTPVFEENAKKNHAQTDVFGNELHRYSIADGIRDKNVLGFASYKVLTFKDRAVRKVVALDQTRAATEEEAISDPKKAEVFYTCMDASKVKIAGFSGEDGKWIKGIEDFLPKSQYLSSEHQSKVVQDILDNWLTLSHNGKFHAIFATSSIPEAIDYYRLLKEAKPELRISCLFDPNISNEDGDYKEYKGQPIAFYKEQGLAEIITDYNNRYGQDFIIATHARFKKDLSLRLAHKEQYKRIEREPDKQLELLIVVDQMLTGFDSKWVNTLYMDKILEYENIIQELENKDIDLVMRSLSGLS